MQDDVIVIGLWAPPVVRVTNMRSSGVLYVVVFTLQSSNLGSQNLCI